MGNVAGKPIRLYGRILVLRVVPIWIFMKKSTPAEPSLQTGSHPGTATQDAEALQASEEKLRTLFETIDEGLCVMELVLDEQQNITDIIYREVNTAFATHSGLDNAIGKRASELVPHLEQYWLDALSRVHQTGVPERTEGFNADLNRWVTTQYSRVGGPGSPLIAAVFSDITERKQHEQHQEFLLRFSDALRLELNADAIADRALRMLIGQLQLDRSYITTYYLDEDRADLDYQIGNSSVPPLPNSFVLSEYPEVFKATFETTVVIDDNREAQGLSEAELHNNNKLGIRAMVAATLRKESKPVWSMVAISSRPRRWTAGEIALVEAVAERTWTAIERAKAAKALQASDEKFRTLFETIDEGLAIYELQRNPDGVVVDFVYYQTNKAFERLTGLRNVAGRRVSELIPNLESDWFEKNQRVADTGIAERVEGYVAELDVWFSSYHSRIGGPGSNLIAGVFTSITEHKQQETRQTFLLQLSDILQTCTGAYEIKTAAMHLLGKQLGLSRAQYLEVDSSGAYYTADGIGYANGLPLLEQNYRMDDFGPFVAVDFDAGRPFESDDLTIDPRLTAAARDAYQQRHIRAGVGVPLIRASKLVAVLAVHNRQSHRWTDLEIELIRETAERVWVAIERTRTEEFLRISEARYRTVLQSAAMGAWDWDVLDDKLRWNDQHFLLVGLPPETDRILKAAFFIQFVHLDDVSAVTAELQQAVDKSGVYQMSAFRIVRADTGTVRWMSGYGRTVSQQDGRSARMVGVMYDITDHIEATQALRDKQLKLDIAQRAARMGIWGYDLHKQQGIATPEWNELTGYPEPGETFELSRFLELVHPDDQGKLKEAHQLMIAEKGVHDVEFRLQHPKNGLLWLLKRGQYIPPYDNVNATLMGSLIDITERKRLEHQKDQFIGIASHELRTPVTSMKAYTEILKELFTESGNDTHRALMEKLDHQVDRLTALIYALLDSARINEGKLHLEPAAVAIDPLIADAAETMQRLADKQKIVLELKAGVTVRADRERLNQVLLNLISNALKYAPSTDRIIIQSVADEKQVTVCVQDFGIGISEQAQQQLFDPFFRDQAASTFPGLGLGLFISANIVREHGGTIWVNSTPGAGAVFCFSLPLNNSGNQASAT
jgi:PAS domain S-box-containing protein